MKGENMKLDGFGIFVKDMATMVRAKSISTIH